MGPTISVRLLIGAVMLTAVATAEGQPVSRARGYLNVNFGLEEGSRNLSVSVPATVFESPGTIDVDDGIGNTNVFDVSGGIQGRRFAFGGGFSRSSRSTAHQYRASTIPFSPGSFVRWVDGVTPALQHREQLAYITAGIVKGITNQFDLMVSGGPAFFSVRQELPEFIIQAGERGDLVSMETRVVTDSAIGLTTGLDLNYMFHASVGIGGVVRYTWSSVDLPDSTAAMTLGGLQIGVGARVRF